MTWLKYGGTLAALLTTAWLVWGQKPELPAPRPLPQGPKAPGTAPMPREIERSAPAPVSDADRILTIQETGKPPQQGRVLESFHGPDGLSHQVQLLETGEIITIVEGGRTASPGPLRSLLSRLFGSSPPRPAVAAAGPPRGRSKSMVAGGPAPKMHRTIERPMDMERVVETIVEGSEPVVIETTAGSASTIAFEVGAERTIQEDGRPSQKCRILAVWRTKDDHQVCQAVSLENGEMMTIVLEGEAMVMSDEHPNMQRKGLLTKVYHWGRYPTSPPGAPVPPKDMLVGDPKTPAGQPGVPDWRKSWGDRIGDRTPFLNKVPESPSSRSAPPRPPTSLTENSKRPDPLVSPDAFGQQQDQKPAIATAHESGPTHPRARVPLGAQSVLAAANGLENGVRYVPVPIVTVPHPKQPPVPPAPELPKPPQANLYVNAFTPPEAYKQQQQQQMQYAMGPQRMTHPGYGPTLAHGYPQQQMYRPMTHPMMPQQPMAPMMSRQTQFGARNYQGPQPPNPFVTHQGMPPPMAGQAGQSHGIAQASFNAAMDRRQPAPPTAAAPVNLEAMQQLIIILGTSVYPSQREWAALHLGTYDWRAHPFVLQALLTAAQEDPAPTVRAGCVNAIARLNADVEPVIAMLERLRTDADPGVRQQADQALTRMNAPQAIQPVRGTP
jgi:hypothetical protein